MYAGRVNLGVGVGEDREGAAQNHLNIERAIPAGSEGSQPMELEVVATAQTEQLSELSGKYTEADHQEPHGKTSQGDGNCHSFFLESSSCFSSDHNRSKKADNEAKLKIKAIFKTMPCPCNVSCS